MTHYTRRLPAPTIPSDLALLILDLDGTLIDSRADLVTSVNAMLRDVGRDELPEERIAAMVGNGAAVLVRRALSIAGPEPEVELEERALASFLAHYARHKLDATTLYPGVAAGLRQLAEAGFTMAVLTNKPVKPSREIVDHLGIAGYFFAVFGGNSFEYKKPDPVGIRALLASTGVEARAAVMIGDSAVDVRCGRNAGTWTAGLTYGFAPESLRQEPPDWLADSFDALAAELCRAKMAQ